MYIRKFTTPAGKKRFKCVVKYQGRQYATKTFDTHGAARKWGRIKEDEIEQLRATRRLPVERITVAELSETYLAHRAEVGQRCPYRPAQVEWWVERIGRLYIGEVTPDDIAVHLDAYASNVSATTGRRPTGATVNRMKAAAGAMFKYAMRKHRLEYNPTTGVLPQPEAKKRMRWLQDDELPRLLDAARQSKYPQMHLIILMALTTGARRSEIGYLRWEDINFHERWAQLHRTKNGKPRKLYLTKDVIEELMKFRRDNGWLFPSPLSESRPMNWENHWRRSLREAGIEGLRFHDLRHTAASWMAEEGKTMAEIAEVLGHSNPNITTWLYTHFTEKHQHDIVDNVLGRRVQRVGRPKE
jgi:integrase